MTPTSDSDAPSASAMSSRHGSSSERSQHRRANSNIPLGASSEDAQDRSQDIQHQSQPLRKTNPSKEPSPGEPSDAGDKVTSSASMKTKSTPRKVHSIKKSKGQSMKSHGKSILKAQGDIAKADDGDFLEFEFQGDGYPTDPAVRQWLKSAEGASLLNKDGKSWKFPNITCEADLYDPLLSIFSKVVGKFVKPDGGFPEGVDRKVLKTPNAQLEHAEEGQHSSPDFVVQAAGRSFETPSNGSPFGFSNMATYFDAKANGDISKNAHIEQMSVYARQIMAHQPNRRFVRCIIISDKQFRLLHFDHAGAQSTKATSINDFTTFIRVLVGLCSIDERRIGLDDSIQWEIVKGKKVKGTLAMCVGPNEEEKTFELVSTKPITHTVDIQGRATTCWAVKDPAPEGVVANTYIVKDSWVSEGRTYEHEHLEKTRGIPGVCELLHWQIREQIKEFRCSASTRQYHNRWAYRILTKSYGLPIHSFDSVLQLLTALLDAIRAHKALYGIGILHRDISNTNVLLGRKDAADGHRGILIDLGVAFCYGADADPEKITKEARSGSRFFQSCTILEYLTRLSKTCPREAPAHDYLDDLEGFFYLLCFLFFLFLPGGAKRPIDDNARRVVEGWDSETAEDALPPKALLLSPARLQKRIALGMVSRSWGEACKDLFKNYLEWVAQIQSEKADLMDAFLEKEEEEVEAVRKNQEGVERAAGKRKENQGKEWEVQWAERSSLMVGQLSEVGEKRPQTKEVALAPLLKDWKHHYDTITGFLESAIEAVKNIPPGPSAPEPVIAEPSVTKRGRRESVAPSDVPDKVPRQKSKCTSKRSQGSTKPIF